FTSGNANGAPSRKLRGNLRNARKKRFGRRTSRPRRDDMRTIHLLRKYDPAQWGGTETAIQRLFAGLREHEVESVVYCPSIKQSVEKDPLAAAGHHIERFKAFVPIVGISRQRKRQIVSVGGNLMSLDLLPRLLREQNPAVVHTHALGRIGGIGRVAARMRNAPLVVTIHGGVLDLPAEMKKEFNQPVGGWEWGKIFGLILRSRRLLVDAD